MFKKYKYSEAFKLMKYRCKECNHEEMIWNSRDGITPFVVSCSKCTTGGMIHIEWTRDIFMPKFILDNGCRYFYTPTKKEWRERWKKYVEEHPDCLKDFKGNKSLAVKVLSSKYHKEIVEIGVYSE